MKEVVNVDTVIQKEDYDKVIPIESFEPEKEKTEENVSFICYICQFLPINLIESLIGSPTVKWSKLFYIRPKFNKIKPF